MKEYIVLWRVGLSDLQCKRLENKEKMKKYANDLKEAYKSNDKKHSLLLVAYEVEKVEV